MKDIDVYIERYLNGDQLAMKPLLAAFHKRVWCMVIAKIPAQDTQDVFQDACLDVFQGLHRLRDRDKFLSWVFSLTRRKIHEYYRNRDRNQADLPLLDALLEDNAGFAAPISQEKALRIRDIHVSIKKLDEPYRTTAIYHFVLGMPYSEVACVLACNENTIKARINRAKVMIFDLLQRNPTCLTA